MKIYIDDELIVEKEILSNMCGIRKGSNRPNRIVLDSPEILRLCDPYLSQQEIHENLRWLTHDLVYPYCQENCVIVIKGKGRSII